VTATGKWIVHSKGGPNLPHFEICVLREDYKFGQDSYGWFGDNKRLITHNGGPCNWPISATVWSGCVAVGQALADELNGSDHAKT
jgi:hypothetical protein